MFARIATRTGVQLPSPPAFARNEVESEVCRAVALAKAGVSLLQCVCCELRLGKPARKNGEVTYVYILQSKMNPNCFYTGITRDLRERLIRHNSGKVPHRAKSKPWPVKTYIAFSDAQRAIEFERYLKSASGRAFLKKHL